ncbi:MAG: hypothetical protein M1554_03195 [Patescibacteria group bacterium]|nr:hypothetical protein [Patescibacteria group bacterium]
MFKFPIFKKMGSSIDQIDIQDIREGIVKINKYKYFRVIQTSSINFQLKNESEQDNIIDIYEGFLNSLNFPIQILIRTREINIDDYLESINQKIKHEKNSIYLNNLKEYKNFVLELINQNKILSKFFYVIIPIELDQKAEFNLVKKQLALRVDLIQKNLKKLNIISHVLDSLSIIELFYSFYNPIKSKLQPISIDNFDISKEQVSNNRKKTNEHKKNPK